jgi:DUF4097 and DUF4098 domain-containing protein YvlB
MKRNSWKERCLILLAAGLVFSLAAAQARASDRQTEEFHQTYELSSNGQVSLDNVNGDVHITGWDQNEVKVDAIKTVWSGTPLSDVRIEVDSHPGSIHIETKVPHHWMGNSHWRVDYTLMVPQHATIDKAGLVNGALEIENMAGDVDASSVNGRIRAQSLSGGVALSAVNGPIEVSFDRPGVSHSISLKTVNGSISLTLPPDANAALSVRTLNGGITCDFPVKINAGYVGHSLDATLGKGGGEIELKTVNGSIAIHRGSSEAN